MWTRLKNWPKEWKTTIAKDCYPMKRRLKW